LAFFCVSKRLNLGALVRIYISQNGPVLTEICSPTPRYLPLKNLPMLKNAVANFGILLRIKKAACGCISMHLHLTKWFHTYRDMFTSGIQQRKIENENVKLVFEV